MKKVESYYGDQVFAFDHVENLLHTVHDDAALQTGFHGVMVRRRQACGSRYRPDHDILAFRVRKCGGTASYSVGGLATTTPVILINRVFLKKSRRMTSKSSRR